MRLKNIDLNLLVMFHQLFKDQPVLARPVHRDPANQ